MEVPPSAPNLPDVAPDTLQQLQAAMVKMVRHVMANTEDVGSRFAEEARKIHYGEREERNIRGQATREETEALLEDQARFDAVADAFQPDIIVQDNVSAFPALKAASPEGAVRLKNGNPGMVFSSTAQYGDEAWASYQGRPVAVGIYKAGELHPSRVFNLD